MKLALAIVCAIVVISNHGTLGTSMPHTEYRPHCNFRCPTKYEPACWAGITFDNECLARRYDCYNQPDDRPSLLGIIIAPGECPNPCDRACPKRYHPVCSDGDTYDNKCLAQVAHCKRGIHTSFEYTSGPCPDPCRRPCTFDYNPVCYKGQTYGNKCGAEIAHCEEGTGKKFKYTPGPCCDKPCPKIHRPVCYNGKTYSNKCLAEIAHCKRNTSKKFVYGQGRCMIPL